MRITTLIFYIRLLLIVTLVCRHMVVYPYNMPSFYIIRHILRNALWDTDTNIMPPHNIWGMSKNVLLFLLHHICGNNIIIL